jgi:hypothetical protein
MTSRYQINRLAARSEALVQVSASDSQIDRFDSKAVRVG